ncbi:MAG TPA: hypothetical protein VH253_01900 [Phycisphaerae bacterium]|nr:hypothetical protein [Phycisphaerae bacterium]
MSDFDKKPADGQSPKQGGKVAVLGLLGLVLAGVLVFHFTKGSPQAATASPVADAGDPTAAVVPTETPAEAQAALANDPTAKLLRGSGDLDAQLAVVPTNPFILDAKWRASLVKTVAPTTAAEPLRAEVTPQPVVAAPQTVNAEGFKLSGIFRDNQHMVAIINGKIVSAGMVVGNARVVDIQPDKVVLRHVNSPTGPTVNLLLKPMP